jgi:ribonuclease HI
MRTSAVLPLPEYLLLVDTAGDEPGEWRLVLEAVGRDVELDITDVEPDARGERLELLTVVRGLEALNQPSRVSVITASRYVRNGIELGLAQWRARGWMWESFGRLERIKHADLWQRVDRAAAIHEIDCAAPGWRIKWEARTAAASADRESRCVCHRLDEAHGVIRRRRERNGFWGLVQAFVRG